MIGVVFFGGIVFFAGYAVGMITTFAFDSWVLRMAWKYQDQALEATLERDALRRLVSSDVSAGPYRDQNTTKGGE